MNKERWRPVAGFEGCYEISDMGRIRSVARWVRCRGGRRLYEGRVLDAHVGNAGYCRAELCNGPIKKTADIHRLVAEAFVPGMQEDVVRHLDGNPINNAAANLAWGTYKDNEDDKRRHGRIMQGDKHHSAVLNNELVFSIRDMHKRGFTQLKIAASLGLNRATVGCVVRGESWTHI